MSTVENLVPFRLHEEPTASLPWFNSPSEKNCWSYGLDVNHDSTTSNHQLLRQWRIKTHWGRVTHICISKLTIIGSDNGFSPRRRQAIIWTNAGMLLIRTLGTDFSQILSEIHSHSIKKIPLKMSSGKWRPFCLGLNVLTPAANQAAGQSARTKKTSHNNNVF